ncbi:hypothetical protein JRO89_XS09G0150000 [Xanthoceras sorbifolium]|uniref:Disease resistance protein At4g27190-like leucine-rich repeats domain-containing protein n=1 Tax=Xanthoceras sorbifolium TaxID=99658 RepID=A0ABQ8HLM0_9ROSI|nr:hypothetical protein JRO89_XS09G0150000 [Xanthoceras sorbifolium]
MCERLLSLESLEVSDCGSLEALFNLQGKIPEEGNSSAAAATHSRELSFSNLQNLRVTFCKSLKNLFANEGVSAQEVSARFCFPKLTSLKLIELPKLRNFYPSRHKVKGSLLKTLDLSHCDTDEECQMQQSLLLEELPKLSNFYPGRYKVKGPVFKTLNLSSGATDEECQMQQSLLLEEV